MPGGPVRHQGVPPLRAPALRDAVPFQDEVRHSAVGQMLAHRQAGLARADDEDFDFFTQNPQPPLRLESSPAGKTPVQQKLLRFYI
ncbi:hypothetical protein GCM10009850_028980 [Nonomuraea monospora]|uniref:Uncharacterized protein n=1 Tax=Nonomuraea monospora TaxID=568818 RepID=A0ABP5PA12_9ACTN